MGILNVTPDSFSDGGLFVSPDAAAERARRMRDEGAAIIDIGGESTRPGAVPITVQDEISRVIPVIAAIRAQADIAISIDTRKADVACAAIGAGATMVNDVSAFTFGAGMADAVAQAEVPVCLMHAQGDPTTMQNNPRYANVVLDVYDFLEQKIEQALAAGISRDRIIVDPGIGFGKTVAHNLALLRGLPVLHALGCPILLGASRKRFIGTLGNGPDAADRLGGSVAVALWGLQAGVQITRVHDTLATKQAFDLQLAIAQRDQREG